MPVYNRHVRAETPPLLTESLVALLHSPEIFHADVQRERPELTPSDPTNETQPTQMLASSDAVTSPCLSLPRTCGHFLYCPLLSISLSPLSRQLSVEKYENKKIRK